MSTAAPRLPRWLKAGYGVSELGLAGVEVMLQLLLLEFYTRAVGLDPGLAGLALGLAVLWDAVTDPAMGVISDHTGLRAGRRRPYILGGALFLATAFFWLFHPPQLDTQAARFAYLLLGFMLVNSAMTIVAVPHSALGGEMSNDRNERTEIFGWRLLFRNGGFFLAVLIPAILVGMDGGGAEAEAASRGTASTILAVVVAATAMVTFRAVRGHDAPAEGAGLRRIGRELRSIVGGLASVLANRVFLPLLLAYTLSWVGRTLNVSLALYYYKTRLQLSESAIFTQVLVVFMLAIVVSIPLWVWLGRRYGKRMPAFFGALTLGVMTFIVYPFLPIGAVGPALLTVSVVGGFAAGSIILFDSLVPDIVDYDELRTGAHREGLYFGCWFFVTKLARAAGLVLTGGLLSAVGYVEGAEAQAEGVAWRLSLLFGPGVGVWFIAGAMVFLWMPLTTAKHAQVQRLLARRQQRS